MALKLFWQMFSKCVNEKLRKFEQKSFGVIHGVSDEVSPGVGHENSHGFGHEVRHGVSHGVNFYMS